MVTMPDDGGDPRVSLRMPEDDLEVVRAVAGDEDYSYSMGHVIRYSMDRKFEERNDVDWESETEHDPELEELIAEYSVELRDEDHDGVEEIDLMLEEEGGLAQNSMEYALKMYALGLEKGDETVQQISREYLEENFPDDEFTNYINE